MRKTLFHFIRGNSKTTVVVLEGEENRNGFRKDAAENYLPAEQHPG